MIEPTADRRAPISPQLAVRVAALGTVALVLFGIIFFRLWFLQVLSGDQFLAEASKNRSRPQSQQAPRGFIVDDQGNPLVENRKAIVLQLDPREVPEAERELAATYGDARARRERRRPAFRGARVALPPPPADLAARFARMRKVTGLSVQDIHRLVVTRLYQEPFAPIVLKEDVEPAVRQFIVEHKKDFRGLDAKTLYLRTYPYKSLGAQLFGKTGEITKDQIGTKRYRGVRLGSIIGQGGLERTYDKYLRGVDGREDLFVDAAGQLVGSKLAQRSRSGRQLRTSINLALQKSAQASLLRAARGKPGAFVAMNPLNGEVYAMGSAPSFDPNVFAKPLTEAENDKLNGADSGAPQVNRATSSQYPTGSTFKPVTALAGLTSGQTTTGLVVQDRGVTYIGKGAAGKRTNAGSKANGPVNLARALQVSSDVYFYELGARIYNKGGRALQSWAHKMGFGRTTGIDTGAEAVGTVPSRAQRDAQNKAEAKCRRGDEYPSGNPKAKGAPCFIADGENRAFNLGDDVNFAIGQGDLTATPMQVALAYTALATGGRIPTPHFGVAIEDDQGKPIQTLKPKAARRVKLPQEGLAAIRAGLHAAASQAPGTSAGVFAGWDQGKYPVYGKTGTAQRPPNIDQSWYAAYVLPAPGTGKTPLVVVATVEGGGFGADAAAPMVRQIFSKYYTGKAGVFTAAATTE